MIPVNSLNQAIKLDINDLPPNQQDRVIRFARELAKSLHQIQLATEQTQKNDSIRNKDQKNNERK